MVSKATNSFGKIPIVLLIVVLGVASVQNSPNDESNEWLAKICREEVSSGFRHAYEHKHRKRFAAGNKRMTWNDSKNWCMQLTRIRNCGTPTLATIDLGAVQINIFTKSKMVGSKIATPSLEFFTNEIATEWYWTGAYIPLEFVRTNSKNNKEWRWVADGSRLSASHVAWAKGKPTNYPTSVCAGLYVTTHTKPGIFDYHCMYNDYPLCHYKAEEQKGCSYPSLPNNSHLTDVRLKLIAATLVIVRCNNGHVVEGTIGLKDQIMICKHGDWGTDVKDCVKYAQKK